jgi:hypothetical protein
MFSSAELLSGQWIKFRDANGPGYAQPDFLLILPDVLAILDSKLTHTPMAERQLRGLYLPLAACIWPGRVTLCVEVCHNVGGGGVTTGYVRELEDVFSVDLPLYTWHWLG